MEIGLDEIFYQELVEIAKNLRLGEWQKIYGTGKQGLYITPCVNKCGNPVIAKHSDSGRLFQCLFCKQKENKKTEEFQSQINALTMDKRINDAKNIIFRQLKTLEEYERPFRVIESKKNEPNYFQSKFEVLTTAELIRSKVKAYHQAYVGKYRVDFLLQELKVVLEVDGGFHKLPGRKEKDMKRDMVLLQTLGPGWRVVRVDENLLKEDIKDLVPMIKRVKGRVLRVDPMTMRYY